MLRSIKSCPDIRSQNILNVKVTLRAGKGLTILELEKGYGVIHRHSSTLAFRVLLMAFYLIAILEGIKLFV